jgi:hypothetical protein
MKQDQPSQDALVEVTFEPIVARYAADDPRSLGEKAELSDALRAVVGGLMPPVTVGTKGTAATVSTVVVALAALNPIGGLVEALKVWLSRDRTRRVEMSVKTPAGERSMQLSATNLDEDQVRLLLAEVVAQFSHDE